MTKAKQPGPKKKTFRVWFPQVNQTYVDVEADSEDEMFEKADRKWRHEYGHNHGDCFKRIDE